MRQFLPRHIVRRAEEAVETLCPGSRRVRGPGSPIECNIYFPNEIFGKRPALRALCLLTALGCLSPGLTQGARATTFSREQDISDLKLGQRVKVDDGTCPPGQVKEVSGAKMTESGVVRTRKCVPRVGIKSK